MFSDLFWASAGQTSLYWPDNFTLLDLLVFVISLLICFTA